MAFKGSSHLETVGFDFFEVDVIEDDDECCSARVLENCCALSFASSIAAAMLVCGLPTAGAAAVLEVDVVDVIS